MKVNNIVVVIFGVVFNTVADQTNSDSEASGLALEIEEDKINKEDKAVDHNLINAQKFIREAKTIIDKANKVLVNNNKSQRDFNYTELGRFTDFIRHIIKILQKYDDNDLELFFAIIDGEVRKYHYRGCKFHELIDNDGLRMFMGKKLETIKSMTAADIRKVLAAVATKLEKEDYDKNEREFVDFINSIYRKDAVEKFNKVLLNVDDYRQKNRRNIDLTEILREGIKSVVFDYYTDLTHNARIAFKSKLDDFWNYIMSVSASYVMQHYLGNLRTSNSAKIFDAGSLSEESSVKTTKDEPMTLRQMYVEKNIDLKYDPYAYDHLTTKYRNVIKKAFSYKKRDPYLDIILAAAKPTHDSLILRNNIERNNSKYPRYAKTHTIKEKRSGKSKSSDRYKYYSKTTDDLRTLRQMHVGRMDSKYNLQVNTDLTKSTSKNDKTSRVHQFKSFDNDNKTGKIERPRKTTVEAKTLRQMYLEHFDFKYYKPQVETDSTELKSKDNIPKHMRTPNKGKHKHKGHHTVKTTDDPSTLREKFVEIMNLKYKPPADTNSKEFKNQSKVLRNKKEGKKKRKHRLREHKTNDNIEVSKAHKQTNIYIDVDTKYITRDDKHKTTKNGRIRKQKYLQKKNKYLSTVMIPRYEKETLDTMTKYLLAQTTHPKKQVMRKSVDDVRVDKRHTTGKPTALEIIEEHNAIINVNAATTLKARRNDEDRNTKQHLKKVIAPLLAKVLSNQLVMSPTSKIKEKPLKKDTSVTNHRRHYTPDNIPSEEGLSIEAFKNSYRRMDSHIHTNDILNDTNVITKIKQLENELNVVKTKLQNDTDIIENLNSKLCETKNKLKEFCNKELQIVMKNKNASEESDSRSADPYEIEKQEEDKSNEFGNGSPKRFQVKRNVRSQYNENENKQALSSKLNKDGKFINNQGNEDIKKNTLFERSRSDIKTKGDIVDKTREKEYNIDAKKLTEDLDKMSSVSKLSKDRIKDDNIKHVSTSNVNNNKYKEHEKRENRDVGMKKFHAESEKHSSEVYNLKTYKQNKINPEGRMIMNNKNIDLDTNKQTYIKVMDKNDYSDEIEPYYNEIERKNAFDPKALPTRIMSSLVTLKKGNPNKIKLDITQANTEIHNDDNVIKVPRKEQVHDAYTKPKMTLKNSMLVDKFDKDGVVIDGEKYSQIEAGDAVQNKPTTEANITVKQWLNVTKVE